MAKIQGLQLTALYERLSKDDDIKGESNSISNQKKYLEDYARKNGFTNIKHFTDDGYTGTNFNRPGFQEMISEVEAGNVGTIIVKDMSRFGRNYLQVGFYTEMVFPQKNVRFIAINNSVDSDNPMDNDFTPFLNIMNEWYAKDTSNKIKSIFNSRMSEGLRCSGSIPYGYNRLPDDKQKLVVDPVASKVVKRIFCMASVGKNLREIAKALEEDKVLIPSAYTAEYHPEQNNNRRFKDPYRWRHGTIHDILNRKEYLGHTVLKKSERPNFKLKNRVTVEEEEQFVFENTHEAIVDENTWELAHKFQEKARRKKVNPSGTFTEGHLLNGFLFCADCGSRMRIAASSTNRDKPYLYYRCGKYSSDTSECSSHNIGKHAIEKLLLETIKRIIRRIEIDEKAFADELKSQYEEQQKTEPDQDKNNLSRYERRYSEVDNLIKGLYENFVLGILPEKQYRSLMAQYAKEQNELEAQINELSEKLENMQQSPVRIEKFIELIRKYTNQTELDEKIVHELVDKIIVHQHEMKGKQRIQKVEICFNFVGPIDLAYNDDELREIQAEQEAKEQRKVARQKEREKAFRERKKAERYEENEGHKYAKRICEHCGKEYWPNGNRQKFCCSECKEAVRREKLLVKRYEEKGGHTFKQRNCVVCGKEFWPTNGQQRVCSDECKAIRDRKRHHIDYIENRKEKMHIQGIENRKARNEKLMAKNEGHLIPKKVCEYCGKEFWPTKHNQKYCSSVCGKKGYELLNTGRNPTEKEGHKFYKRVCTVCGKEYWPNGPNDLTCSSACARTRELERHRVNYIETTEKKTEAMNNG